MSAMWNNQVTQSQSVPQSAYWAALWGQQAPDFAQPTNQQNFWRKKQSFKLKNTEPAKRRFFPNRQVANQMTNTRMGTRRTTIHSKLTP